MALDKLVNLLPAKISGILLTISIPVVITLSGYIIRVELRSINSHFDTIEAENKKANQNLKELIVSQVSQLQASQQTSNAIFIKEFQHLNKSQDYNEKLDQVLLLLNQVLTELPKEVPEEKITKLRTYRIIVTKKK